MRKKIAENFKNELNFAIHLGIEFWRIAEVESEKREKEKRKERTDWADGRNINVVKRNRELCEEKMAEKERK